MAVIETWPRSTTIVAEDEMKVIEIGEKDLNAFFKEDPDRILGIMKQMGGRLRDLTKEYEEVTSFLREKQEKTVESSSGFKAKLKKYREISKLSKKNSAGMSAEIANRMMYEFKPEDSPLPIAEYPAGTIIFRQGETGYFMYGVQSGAVGIYINFGTAEEQKLTTIYPNEFFGEMSLIDQENRSATAIAEQDETVVEMIRLEDLKALFKANPMEVDMILRHLSGRLRRLTIDYAKACEAAAAE